MKEIRKKIIWFVVFIVLVALTLFTIIGQNKAFSIEGFKNFIFTASWQWIVMAFVSVFGFIVFEGLALVVLCRAFGYKIRWSRGIVYLTPDIYFSAITPSATGGQPASAYFMMKDKIPGAVTTIILLINLTLYAASIIVIGILCFLARPGMLAQFSVLSKCLIVAGFVIQFALMLTFLMLVYKEKIIIKIATSILKVLGRLHLVHHIERKQQHLLKVEEQYKECADAIKNHKKPLALAFVLNLLQRISLIMVSVCVFIAKGGAVSKVLDVFTTQGYVVLGSNSVPIPGAVGAADYLFIDGFGHLVSDPVSIELLSRGISFYCCIIVCGIVTLLVYLVQGLKGMKRRKNDRIL